MCIRDRTASIRPMVERAAGAGRYGSSDADVTAFFRGIRRASPLGIAKAGDKDQSVPVRSAFCALRLLRVERMARRGFISAAAAGRLMLLEIGGVDEKMAVLVALRLDLFTVSYTHLDVYKRQGPSSVRAILIKRKRPRSSSNRVTACDQVSLVSQMGTGQREGAASASPLRLSYRLCLLYTSRCV